MTHWNDIVPPSFDIADRDPRVQAHRAQFGVAQGLDVPSGYHRARARYDWGSGEMHDPFVTHAAWIAGYPKSFNDWNGQHLTGAPMNAGLTGMPFGYRDWSGQHLTGAAMNAGLTGMPNGYRDWSGRSLVAGPAEYAALTAFPDHYGEWCGGAHEYDHLVGAGMTGMPHGYYDWSGNHLVGRGAGGGGGHGGGGGGHGGGHGGFGGHGFEHGFVHGGWGGWGPWGWDNAEYPMPMLMPVLVDDGGLGDFGDDDGEF